MSNIIKWRTDKKTLQQIQSEVNALTHIHAAFLHGAHIDAKEAFNIYILNAHSTHWIFEFRVCKGTTAALCMQCFSVKIKWIKRLNCCRSRHTNQWAHNSVCAVTVRFTIHAPLSFKFIMVKTIFRLKCTRPNEKMNKNKTAQVEGWYISLRFLMQHKVCASCSVIRFAGW